MSTTTTAPAPAETANGVTGSVTNAVSGATSSVTDAVSGVGSYFGNFFNKKEGEQTNSVQTGGRKSSKSITIPHVITDNGKKVTGVLQTGVDGVGRGLSGFVRIGKSITHVAQTGVDGVSRGIKKTVGGRKSKNQRKSKKQNKSRKGKSRRTRR